MPRKKTAKELYELKDIETKEVSLVDKAANLKKFLVVKNAEAGALEDEIETLPSTEEAMALLPGETVVEAKAEESAEATESPAPDVDASEEPTVPNALAEPTTAELLAEGSESDVSKEVVSEAVAEVVVDEPATAQEPSGDVVKEDAPVASGEPAMKIHPGTKRALAGALSAVSARVEGIVSALNGAEEDLTSTRLPWELEAGINYLLALVGSTSDLTCEMYGAEWEIEAAAVAEMAKAFKVEKATAVEKIGRAISGARMRKMKDLHASLATVEAQFKSIIAEVETDAPVAEDVGKAASVTIEEVTTLTNQVTELTKSQASDRQHIAALREELRKQKELLDMPTKPNAARGEDPVQAAEVVVWPSDLAPKRR